MSDGGNILFVVVSAFLLSTISVWLVATLAARIDFRDRYNPNTRNPGGAAMGGGIPVVLAILLTALWNRIPLDGGGTILLSVAMASLLGLIDDIKALHPGVKVLGQCICAAVYLYGRDAGMTVWFVAGPFLIIAANAWNVVDVMDGLAACIGTLCLVGAAAIFFLYGNGVSGLTVLSLLSAATLAGFLLWNRPPARVLLGDAGSIPLGLLFGILIVEAWMAAPQVGGMVALIGIIPFFEVVFIAIERSRRGIPFYRVTPDHFALRLKRHGRSDVQVLRLIIFIGVLLDLLAIVVAVLSFNRIAILLAGLIVLLSAMLVYRYLLRLSPEQAQ